MSDKRFSTVVGRYFRKRDTHPVTLMFKNSQVDNSFLIELYDAVRERFGQREDIELVSSVIVEGQFWSGVLVEFNQSEFEGVDSDAMLWSEEDVTLNSCLLSLYSEFDEEDTRSVGFSTGEGVYPVAALESLGKEHFKTASDVYSGPSL